MLKSKKKKKHPALYTDDLNTIKVSRGFFLEEEKLMINRSNTENLKKIHVKIHLCQKSYGYEKHHTATHVTDKRIKHGAENIRFAYWVIKRDTYSNKY